MNDQKVTVRVSAELLSRIEAHRVGMEAAHGIQFTQADAVRHLLEKGLAMWKARK